MSELALLAAALEDENRRLTAENRRLVNEVEQLNVRVSTLAIENVKLINTGLREKKLRKYDSANGDEPTQIEHIRGKRAAGVGHTLQPSAGQ